MAVTSHISHTPIGRLAEEVDGGPRAFCLPPPGRPPWIPAPHAIRVCRLRLPVDVAKGSRHDDYLGRYPGTVKPEKDCGHLDGQLSLDRMIFSRSPGCLVPPPAVPSTHETQRQLPGPLPTAAALAVAARIQPWIPWDEGKYRTERQPAPAKRQAAWHSSGKAATRLKRSILACRNCGFTPSPSPPPYCVACVAQPHRCGHRVPGFPHPMFTPTYLCKVPTEASPWRVAAKQPEADGRLTSSQGATNPPSLRLAVVIDNIPPRQEHRWSCAWRTRGEAGRRTGCLEPMSSLGPSLDRTEGSTYVLVGR